MEAQALATVRQLLTELDSSRGLEELAAHGPSAQLESELGLGSLERVELMLRLGQAFGRRLPERVFADANTVQDLIDAMVRESGTGESAHPDVRLASSTTAPVPSPAAHRAELEDQIRRAGTLTEVLRLRGHGDPGRVHLQLYEEDEQLRTITFGELYHRASAVAVGLQQRGLEPAQTVAIMLPTCAEFFHSFAGILLAGGIPVPIYPPFRADRIAEYAARQANILRNAEARLLITFRQAEGLARLLQPRVPTLRAVLNAQQMIGAQDAPKPVAAPGEWQPVEHLRHRAQAEDIAFLQYTSGSTGDPKGVTLTHSNLLANIHAILSRADVQPEDVVVSWLPLYHDMGLIGAWLVPLVSGIPTVVMSPLAFLSRPERWLWAIHRHRGTLSPAPNFAYELCLRKIADQDLQGLDLSCWRAALNGAETVRADTMQKFAARFAAYGLRREALVAVYGLAEASLAVSMPKFGSGYKVERVARKTFESEGRAVPAGSDDPAPLEFVNAGRPLANVEVRIVTSKGAEAGERAEGRLWFRSPSATSGYYHNPSATGELIREQGWLDSGDLAYLVGGEIYITGRAKDVIIKGGRNLLPQEIEEVTGRIAGVRPGGVIAFGVPDARSGTERLVVAAEVRDLARAQGMATEISRAVDLAMGLPPDEVKILPPQSIPKTSSGKLRRSETRRLYLEGTLGKKLAPAWVQVARLAVASALPRPWLWLKGGVRRGIELLYGFYALSVFVLVFLPSWAVIGLTPRRPLAARVLRAASRLALLLSGIPVRVVGGEILEQARKAGPWIFAPNHSSYLDIVVNLAHLPWNVRFVVKAETLRMPLIGTIARRTGQLAFDRSDPQARIQEAKKVIAALERGESVVIYPEGTFTATAGVRPFHLGAFKAAVDTQRPICPVAVRGARAILRDHTYLPRPGHITLTVGPLLVPHRAAGADWQEVVRLRDETRQIISRYSGEPLL
jgi:fatty-acyl-CoA synthase